MRRIFWLILYQTKSDYAENDAISDDMAGQAYIEQFGLETFQRAENAMKANRASRYGKPRGRSR